MSHSNDGSARGGLEHVMTVMKAACSAYAQLALKHARIVLRRPSRTVPGQDGWIGGNVGKCEFYQAESEADQTSFAYDARVLELRTRQTSRDNPEWFAEIKLCTLAGGVYQYLCKEEHSI